MPSSPDQIDEADPFLNQIEGDYLGILLYGSVARGDHTPSSDIDLLQLVRDRTEHYQRGRTSVAVYTDRDLQRMCEGGSLFALHLVTEGRILVDPRGVLSTILGSYRPPASNEPMWREIKAASAILDATDEVVAANPIGLNRLALYLLRCAAILENLERSEQPCFAIGQLQERLSLPGFAEAFEGRENAESLDGSRLRSARSLLARIQRQEPHNPFGSLEALAVNLEVEHPVAARLALRILAGERTLGYGDLLLDPTLPPDV